MLGVESGLIVDRNDPAAVPPLASTAPTTSSAMLTACLLVPLGRLQHPAVVGHVLQDLLPRMSLLPRHTRAIGLSWASVRELRCCCARAETRSVRAEACGHQSVRASSHHSRRYGWSVLKRTSTRRLRLRPSGLSLPFGSLLGAMGRSSPNPSMLVWSLRFG